MKIGKFFVALGLLAYLPTQAYALPKLQLFIESEQGDGSSDQNTYWDATTQTWVRVGNTPFYLWAVVKTQTSNITYTWDQLNLTAVGPSNYFDSNQANGTLSVTATGVAGTVAGYTLLAGPNFGVSSDLSNPLPSGYLTPTLVGTDQCCTSEFAMPTHGEYDASSTWASWSLLGNSTLSSASTPIGQFQPTGTTEPFFNNGSNYPTLAANDYGVIFRYLVSPTGLSPGDVVHFDLWGHVSECDPQKNNCESYYFAPFSHDAQWEQGGEVPAPAALFVFGAGLLGLGVILRRRQSRT